MVNEAIRTRQYKEVLDAEKNISRQIYNLYQRQENAYNEHIPSIRNQNQLAPISGVIDAVNSFQTELQNLLNNAANTYFKNTVNNFVPVVKAFNTLVFALRSIQNIYKSDIQIKYEVDKLLKPVIDLIQSLASQLAYDPAVSNRLFQMKTNLLSKVYERIDFNVGKRTVIKLDGDQPPTVQTFQPGSQEKLDTFEQPVQYDPQSNDPFLKQERIKPEPEQTFYGLSTDGLTLNEEEENGIKTWLETIQYLENSPVETILNKNKQQLQRLAEERKKTAVEEVLAQSLVPMYDAFSESIQERILEKNKVGLRKIKDVYETLLSKVNNFKQNKQNKIPRNEIITRAKTKAPETAVPTVSLTMSSPPPNLSSAESTPGSASITPKTLDAMSDEEIKKMLTSKMGTGVFNQLKKDKQFKAQSWSKIIENIKNMYRQDPEFAVKHLNLNYNIKLLSPSSGRQRAASSPFSPPKLLPFIESPD